jgi:prolyl 4-hydroxylase
MADVSDEANARDFVRRTLENSSASSTAKRPRQIRVVIAADGVQRVTPPMPDDAHRLAIFVPNAVAAPVCAALIERTEALGYRTAKMSVAGGDAVVLRDVRDNDTVVLHDSHVANALWESVQPHVPGGATARLDSRLRFYRYSEGHFFSKHQDGATVLEGEESRYTLICYLSENFDGGCTRLCVYDDRELERSIDIKPATGAVFVFDHYILHSSTPITRGTKWAVRADVLVSTRVGEGACTT